MRTWKELEQEAQDSLVKPSVNLTDAEARKVLREAGLEPFVEINTEIKRNVEPTQTMRDDQKGVKHG